MSNNLQETFKSDLFQGLGDVNKKLNEGKDLTQEDLALLLMSSILEEEG